MAYTIHLENFEGPLDLLLYFIQRDKIDIYDIPISRITNEYLEYLDLIKALNLGVAGEFIMLAATLMRVKAKMLLPRPEVEGEELIEDPRQELVEQLINYQRFKSAAGDLGNLAEIRSAYYPTAGIEIPPLPDSSPGEYLNDVSLFDLMSVFKDVLGRMPSTEPLRLKAEPIKLDEKVRIIRKALSAKGQVSFKEVLLASVDRHDIVVTFLAVLEMVKRKILLVVQSGPFGEILLQSIGAEA